MRSKKVLPIVLIPLLAAVFAGPASAGPADEHGTVVSAVTADPYGLAEPVTRAFWTLRRMAEATPLGTRLRSRPSVSADASRPSARTWTGSPVVGALFLSNGSGSHYCTASVVDSARKSLLLTAAHCLYGSDGWARNLVFVPRYSQGHRPYGAWTVGSMYVDSRWTSRRDQDLDFGFAVVGANDGRRVADVVGANHLITDQGYTNAVRVIGYPMAKYAPADKPIYCNATTHKAFKYQIDFDCDGYYGGTSGSPWIKNYDTTTRRGDVLGVIGGYEEGGKYDWRSYSPVFDKDIRALYASAAKHG